MGLTDEQILALYTKKQRKPSQAHAEKPSQASSGRSNYPRIRNSNYLHLPDNGPIKLYDQTHRCSSRGCSSPTYYKLRGIPYCPTHIIVLLATEVANDSTSGAGVGTNGADSINSNGTGASEFTGSLTSEGTL